jgi:hypothetical protein
VPTSSARDIVTAAPAAAKRGPNQLIGAPPFTLGHLSSFAVPLRISRSRARVQAT